MTLEQTIAPKLAKQYLHRRLKDVATRLRPVGSYPDFNTDEELQIVDVLMRRHRREATEGLFLKTMAGASLISEGILEAARASIANQGMEWAALSSGERLVTARLFARAELEALRIYRENLRGNFTDAVIEDTLFTSSLSKSTDIGAAAKKDTHTLKEITNVYLKQMQDRSATKTVDDYKRIFARLYKHLGEDRPICDVDKEDIRLFRDQLVGLHGVHQAAGQMSNKTAKKYFGFVKTFFNWAVGEGYIEASPVGGITVPKNKPQSGEVQRASFSLDEIGRLLNSPVFVGYRSRRYYAQSGDVKKQRAEFWCLVIAMLSGMRLGEIVQLTRKDLRKQDGIWIFDINTGDGSKRVKTAAGCRHVPVHPKLMDLGLLKWIKATPYVGDSGLLFPSLQSSVVGDPANTASKRLNRYLCKVGIKRDKRMCIHSLRHSFIDQLRHHSTQEYVIKKVVGHAEHSVTSSYGDGASLSVCFDAVAKCYSSIDFEVIQVRP
ncbi:tyrosine-type recombinase/integrase [Kordiimonas sp.]|uniref:site-specific integrase n=1 Tax=Kordiimonas sp. TaxID=1970157 RepID=UPI003A93EF2E